MKDISKETQALIDLVRQAKSAEEDIQRSFKPDHVLNSDDYVRVHTAQRRTEGARWRAMVALAKEAGMQ